MNSMKVIMFPTSPTIAQSIGEFSFWLALVIFLVFAIAVATFNPKKNARPMVQKPRPWLQPRK